MCEVLQRCVSSVSRLLLTFRRIDSRDQITATANDYEAIVTSVWLHSRKVLHVLHGSPEIFPSLAVRSSSINSSLPGTVPNYDRAVPTACIFTEYLSQ